MKKLQLTYDGDQYGTALKEPHHKSLQPASPTTLVNCDIVRQWS